MYEHEIKHTLKNAAEVAEKLNELDGFDCIEETQLDMYFTPFHVNFLEEKPITEWFRVRKTETGAELCYKNWGKEKGTCCLEHEVVVSDCETILAILSKLGFREIIKVDKKRRTWRKNDLSISIDSVDRLGMFIEIEIVTSSSDSAEALRILEAQLESLGAEVGERNYTGYPFMLIEENARA